MFPALLHPSGRSVTVLLCLAFVFLWNSGFIAAEYVLPRVGPLTLLFWRYWVLALLLLVYLCAARQLLWPGGKAVGVAALVGVLAHGVWLGCVFYALDEGVPAGIVALVVALQPLLTGVLSGRVVGEPPTPRMWLGLVLGFAGVGVAVGSRTAFSAEGSLFGHLLPFGSVLAITVASLIQRKLAVRSGPRDMPLLFGLFVQSLATALVVSLPAIFLEGLATRVDAGFLAGMGWLIGALSFGAYGLMWLLIRRLDATRVASLFYLGPPVTMLMAWAAFGDHLLWTDWVGLGVVVLGVMLSQSGRRVSAD